MCMCVCVFIHMYVCVYPSGVSGSFNCGLCVVCWVVCMGDSENGMCVCVCVEMVGG